MGALALRLADLREFEGEARVEDLRLANLLGYNSPKEFRRVIQRHIGEIVEYGVLPQVDAKIVDDRFSGQTDAKIARGRGRPGMVFLLNEAQAVLITMFSRTERAALVRKQVIEVFIAWRKGRLVPAGQASAERQRRKGRGRLSSIDRLPVTCAEDVAWVRQALIERRLPQTHILDELNARIVAKGERPISKSAFSRFTVMQAIEIQRIEQSRQITDEVLARVGNGEHADAMIAAAEVLRERTVCAMSRSDISPRESSLAALTLERIGSVVDRARARREICK